MSTDKYGELDALLDQAAHAQTDWLTDLQCIRLQADVAYNKGELARCQWQALIARSAKIQDQKNGD